MLHLYHGPDDYSRAEKIAHLKTEMGDIAMADLNTAQLDGRNLKLGEIRHHADAAPFLAAKRLVIVTDYLTQLGRKASDAQPLLDYLGQLSPTTELVFIERESLDKRHPIFKISTAEIIHFAAPSAKSLPEWILQHVNKNGFTIEAEAADLLGRLVGPNLQALHNEIDKLTLYAHTRKLIRKSDVELLVPYMEEAEDFGFSNALGQRNAARAFDQLHKMVDEGKHPMAILATIATQIRALIEVKDMAERGMNAGAIAQAKGWKSDFAAKSRLNETKNFSMARLERILEMLLETDLAIKTSQIDALLALDMLIGQLCSAENG